MATINYIKYQNRNSHNAKAYGKWYGRHHHHRNTDHTDDHIVHEYMKRNLEIAKQM